MWPDYARVCRWDEVGTAQPCHEGRQGWVLQRSCVDRRGAHRGQAGILGTSLDALSQRYKSGQSTRVERVSLGCSGLKAS